MHRGKFSGTYLPHLKRVGTIPREITLIWGCCRNTWRGVYTVRFKGVLYVLHVFQKKSKSGIATPKSEIDLIHKRLASAEQDYKERKA